MLLAAARKNTGRWYGYLTRDKLALVSLCYLIAMIFSMVLFPIAQGDAATQLDLQRRNLVPFSWDSGWLYVLGSDNLGRSMLARLIVGAGNTVSIATAAVLISMVVGGFIGLCAGYTERWWGAVIMRLADIVMSFPSLLLALVVLYTLGSSKETLILVLSISRSPIYLRTARAETLEIRERSFVSAAHSMGASSFRIILRHVLPFILPTLSTIAAIDFATVILTESALSFLGLGIQPPEFTWGSMVASGRGSLATTWWISLWPGLLILATTLSLNILSNWLRLAKDPQQRWRLENLKRASL